VSDAENGDERALTSFRNLETIQSRFWYLRNRVLGVTLQELCHAVNRHLEEPVALSTVSNFEARGATAPERKRASEPRASFLAALRRAYPHIELEWLVLGEGPATVVSERAAEYSDDLEWGVRDGVSFDDYMARHQVLISAFVEAYMMPPEVSYPLTMLLWKVFWRGGFGKIETDDKQGDYWPTATRAQLQEYLESRLNLGLSAASLPNPNAVAVLLSQVSALYLLELGSRPFEGEEYSFNTAMRKASEIGWREHLDPRDERATDEQ